MLGPACDAGLLVNSRGKQEYLLTSYTSSVLLENNMTMLVLDQRYQLYSE